ncbi:hypothetical protein HYC85_016840 [Camellia sinensis]|uniref:Uncharacterized protein n=1 Tax=Camellia sinensis TaxID=4442 RepID=A0A7J7H0R5_CAMSI|nr:hypothetical protein HYC85_016840 [Camellia sinensis]
MRWCRVSQFGTHPINSLFGDNGMTTYLLNRKIFLCSVSGIFQKCVHQTKELANM